jgi:hypothetical protein
MATLHPFEPRHRPAAPTAFTKAELSQMLSVYSRRVAGGEWRDYAIDNREESAVFSIFRRTFEPPVFAIVKHPPEQSPEFDLFAGAERLDSKSSLTDLLTMLESRLRLVQG